MDQIIKLTQTVQKGGCAAKVSAIELRKILALVQFPENSKNVLVDGSQMDDAGIIKVNSEIALVQTLDFFTPIVDSPYLFGQIAAVNAISDVYAMGGLPSSAMAILAFSVATMDKEIIAQVLQGASDKVKEAKADFVGGHSIDDDTLKFGLSVTGYVHPLKIWKNSGAQHNDKIILTKPIGTGTATAALKRQAVTESEIGEEIKSMCQLNNIIQFFSDSDISNIHAATDVTGFGLAGHTIQMARASHKTIQIDYKKIPLFSQTIKFLESGFLTKAHKTNQDYVSSEMLCKDLSDLESKVLFDPQTSGGLLLSVSNESCQTLIEILRKNNIMAAEIGKVFDYDKISRLVVYK